MQTYENGTNLFSPLGNYSKKSQKRKALASLESRMGGKKRKKVTLLLKLGDKMLRPYIIETASKCVAMKADGVHTNLQKDAATNPPIQGTKYTVICVQEKQMLTEVNSKCVKATLQTGI